MTAANKAVAMRWQNMFRSSQEDLSKLDEFLAADFVSHSTPPGLDPGIEGVKQMVRLFQNAFPDMGGAVEDVVAEGDKVVVRFSGTGTHQGGLLWHPADRQADQVHGDQHLPHQRWQNRRTLEQRRRPGLVAATGRDSIITLFSKGHP